MLTEQIKDGVNGLLVPPGDSEALADAIRRIVNNPQLGARLVRQAKKKTNEFSTWEAVMERTTDLIRDMVKEE